MTDKILKENLQTYGVDIPVPSSKDELVCDYREDEENPVVLSELDGYKVPPPGIAYVSKSGSGHSHSRIMYGNGTFRFNHYAVNQALGPSQNDMQLAKAKAKQTAIMEGVMDGLNDSGIMIHANTEAGMLYEVAKVVTKKVVAEKSAREARMWFNDINKIYSNQEEIIKDRDSLQAKMNEIGAEALDIIIQEAKRNIERQSGIIEGEFEDIEIEDAEEAE